VLPRWNYGDAVRLKRNVRNDGTFPGVPTGRLLVRRGRIGHVRDVGTFLQDQIIYSVHFLDEGRLVGCREDELVGVNEAWIESRFEVRQRVRALRPLAVDGKVRVPAGSRGEILHLEKSEIHGVVYRTHFDCLAGVPVWVPEAALGEWRRSGDA
jgi:nitrogen fixation protein NifZ